MTEEEISQKEMSFNDYLEGLSESPIDVIIQGLRSIPESIETTISDEAYVEKILDRIFTMLKEREKNKKNLTEIQKAFLEERKEEIPLKTKLQNWEEVCEDIFPTPYF